MVFQIPFNVLLLPGDVIVSNITMNSANVSWIVPSVTEPQEYYVLYGVNQIILNLTTDKVQGNSDTSLLNQSYSTIVQDLDYGTTYYLIVVTEFGSTTLYSEMTSFTTIEPGNIVIYMVIIVHQHACCHLIHIVG